MTPRLVRSLLAVTALATAGTAHAQLAVSATPVAIPSSEVPTPSARAFQVTEGSTGVTDDLDFDLTSASCGGLFAVDTPRITVTSASAPTVNVTYTPAARGLVTCHATLKDHGTATVRLTFDFTGTATGPALTAPASVAFTATRVTTGAINTQIVTLKNSGEDALTISSLALMTHADYSIMTQPTLPLTLAPNLTTTVTLAFDPQAAGARTDTLVVGSTAVGAPTTAITLSGQGTNATIAVSDAAFGTVLNNTTSVKTITVSNTGAIPVGTLAVTGETLADASGWFAFDSSTGCAGQATCAQPLNVATTAAFKVTCKPTPANATGTKTATVTFTSDTDPVGAGANVATLTCTAGRSVVTVDTMALAYGNVTVGQSGTLSVTVHNGGTSALTYSFAAPGTPFTVTSGPCAPCTIAAGGPDKLITVKFTPTAIGDVTGTLGITTNDPDTATVAVTLTGTGTASQIAGAPGTLAFGNVDVGKSLPLVLTVSNTGNAPLNISGATLTAAGVFSVTDGLLTMQTIQPGDATTWTIKCTPIGQGAKTGSFLIASDSLANPMATVTLTCNGQLGQLAVTPTPFDFGGVRQGDAVPHTFTITNAGNTVVSGITATLTVPNIGYAILTPPSASLAGGGTTSMVVQFSPQSAADGGMDQVTIAGAWGTAPQSPVSATLDLNGTDKAAGYDVSAATLAFGDIRWDTTATQKFTITLTDPTPLSITQIDIAPDLVSGTQTGEITQVQLLDNGSPATLPIRLDTLTDVITVGIKLDPANRLGPLKATVTVTSDLTMNPSRQVVVTGNSVSPELALTPATGTLDFGKVDVDGAPASLPITLTNTGDGVLTVGAYSFTNPQGTFTFSPQTSPSTIAPHDSATVMVTYTPVLEETDTATVVVPLSGIFGTLDGSQTVQITGQGIDRHFALAQTALAFPPTYRYPEAPPVLAAHVTNTGEATLHVHMVEITGSTAFTLVDASMVEIAGGASHDFQVTFDPHAAGPATQGILELDNDDTAKGQPDAAAHVTLDGIGLAEAVAMNPMTINLGEVGIGIPRKVSDLMPGGIVISNTDPTATFHIKDLTLDEEHFSLIGDPADVDLAPAGTMTFDAEIAPTDVGDIHTTVSLYIGIDPDPVTTLELHGHGVFVDARGTGGCAAGGGAGGAGGMLLVAAALLAARKRGQAPLFLTGCRTVGALGVLAAAAGGALADPPTRDLDTSVFHPTPSTTDASFGVQAASVGSSGDFALSALLSYAAKPLELVSGTTADVAIANRTLIDLGGAYAFLGRFEAAAHMPLYAQSGDVEMDHTQPGVSSAPASGTARGDLTLDAKARLFRSAAGAVQLGVAAALTLPTATADQFAGVADPTGRVLGLATVVPGGLARRLALSVNAGGVLRARETYANIDQKSGYLFGAGASYRLLDALWLAGEVYGEVIPNGVRTGPPDMTTGHAPTAMLHTSEFLVGVRYQVERRTSLGFALGRGLDAGFGAPQVRGVFSMTFVAGQRALAPIHPPPPPKIDGDADGDGIRDSVDKCPTEAEDKDGFQDEDGCPDPDNDHDGIPDAQDKCPLGAEDKDGFQDEDGCPDLDNDKDGILDAKDRCPNEPEDKDGFQDGDGCPDPDNDHDGILDDRDKCPNQPETINGVEDEDGCPDAGDPLVIVNPDRLDLLDTVKWNGAKIAKASENLLGQVGATLRAHDEIVRLRVTVHVQPTGNPDRDKQLTEKRAQAVRDFLVKWGIAATRVEAKGFGGTKPIVAADKKGSAALNERLELIILERK